MKKLDVLCQRSEEEPPNWKPPDIHLSLTALTTTAIPFFRICEAGLMDIKEGKVVGLMVS
ncbi:hypothetical protein ACFLW2_04605 [Chloroflexota bacterium]